MASSDKTSKAAASASSAVKPRTSQKAGDTPSRLAAVKSPELLVTAQAAAPKSPAKKTITKKVAVPQPATPARARQTQAAKAVKAAVAPKEAPQEKPQTTVKPKTLKAAARAVQPVKPLAKKSTQAPSIKSTVAADTPTVAKQILAQTTKAKSLVTPVANVKAATAKPTGTKAVPVKMAAPKANAKAKAAALKVTVVTSALAQKTAAKRTSAQAVASKTAVDKKGPAKVPVAKAVSAKPAADKALPEKAALAKASPSKTAKTLADKASEAQPLAVKAAPANTATAKTVIAKKAAVDPVEVSESILPDYWDEACRYLVKKDRILRKLIPKYTGMGGLQSHGDAFSTLARSIVSQQISTTAAAAVWARVEQSVRGKLTATKVLALDVEGLRACGLSARKTEYLRDLALHVQEGRLNVKAWQQADDEAIIAELTAVRGIGRWTAEMFLMFHLMRPNVLPLDDLGLIQGISRNYFSGEPVSRSDAREVAEGWKPWRTVATWYMWRSLAQPQAY